MIGSEFFGIIFEKCETSYPSEVFRQEQEKMKEDPVMISDGIIRKNKIRDIDLNCSEPQFSSFIIIPSCSKFNVKTHHSILSLNSLKGGLFGSL